MKKMFILLGTLFCLQAFAVDQYETRCKQGDCFRYGWVTTGPDYSLDTVCKNSDCTRYGWHSVTNDQSTYDVVCCDESCFQKGWASVQEIGTLHLEDEVTCKSNQCLTHGWTVKTGYDFFGGEVTCHDGDCSKFGGSSVWRGRPSSTACYSQDCYHLGWTLLIQ